MVASARRGWIGVDIGTRSVKLVQLERAAAGVRLVEAMAIPRRTGPDGSSTAVGDIPGAREEIAVGLALGRRFSGRAAACTVSMRWCQARPLRIPAGDPAQQRTCVAQELSAICADWADGYEFDHWSTDPDDCDEAAPLRNVIAFSMLRRLATGVGEDLTRAGLHCHALDGLPLALTRMVRLAEAPEADRPVAAVDWGFSDATFCAISHGRPIFVRRLRACGFSAVLQSVATGLGLSVDEAELLLAGGSVRQSGSVAVEFARLLPEISPRPLNTMIEELHRTLKFFQHQFGRGFPQRIWLFGAGAAWKEASGFLSSRINLPVEIWRPEASRIQMPQNVALPGEILAPAIAMSSIAWLPS